MNRGIPIKVPNQNPEKIISNQINTEALKSPAKGKKKLDPKDRNKVKIAKIIPQSRRGNPFN
jgi:hypothetical protein